MIDLLKSHIEKKEIDHLKVLISEHPEVLDEKDETGKSGFLHIAYSGLSSIFDHAVSVKKIFSFHEAIISGKEPLVRDLVTNNKELVNAYSPDGFTPIALAAFFDYYEIVKMLLEHGAPNLHATNMSKVNALHAAVAKNNLRLCQLLIEHDADVNATQMQNVTPLHSAAHHGNLELVKMLKSNGARLDSKMENGKTAIDIATEDGHRDIQTFLKQ